MNNKEINTELEVLWEGKPSGLLQRFLTTVHLNFTTYQITKDELIVTTGFFKKRTNTVELYMLKDPDATESIYQRILKIGTVSVVVDTHGSAEKIGTRVWLKNVQDPQKVRKILRDAIEADVMERKITYFDKV
jgi:uncharacterized membrane protein YdbT with pleckstrin-like domain